MVSVILSKRVSKDSISSSRFVRSAIYSAITTVVLTSQSFAYDSTVDLMPGTPVPQFDVLCQNGQVLYAIVNNQPRCMTPPPGPQGAQGPQGSPGPQGSQGPQGIQGTMPPGYYTQVASRALNAFNSDNYTNEAQMVIAYSYCPNGQTDITGNVDGMTVAQNHNYTQSAPNDSTITFMVPPNTGYGVNALCASGGYINVYTYSYNN